MYFILAYFVMKIKFIYLDSNSQKEQDLGQDKYK